MPRLSSDSHNLSISHSFVMRVSPRDADALGNIKLSIKVVHVSSNATRRFASTKSAFEFISQTIDRLVLRPLH
jgi:hypothetical protein